MWTLKSEDRLREWKAFRKEIGTLPFDTAVQKTVHLWSYAPFVSHYLDHSEPQDWPDPWQLLDDNKYDDMAKALGMLYTLYLSDHGKDHTFTIAVAQASNALENYNLVLIDEGKYALNFVFDQAISNLRLDTEVSIIKQYTANDLKLSKY